MILTLSFSWKCKRAGHLPEDCTVTKGIAAASPSDPYHYSKTEAQPKKGNNKLKRMFNKCMSLSKQKDHKCAVCGARNNLAFCLDCDGVYCDGSGHLLGHLEETSHRVIYSFKLRKQIKCCNTDCEEMDISKLLACAHCLEKAFTTGYNMINATWSGNALKKVPNAICCDDHFQWHLHNCLNAASSEHVLEPGNQYNGTLSEVIF
jgi:hypothetical protein